MTHFEVGFEVGLSLENESFYWLFETWYINSRHSPDVSKLIHGDDELYSVAAYEKLIEDLVRSQPSSISEENERYYKENVDLLVSYAEGKVALYAIHLSYFIVGLNPDLYKGGVINAPYVEVW